MCVDVCCAVVMGLSVAATTTSAVHLAADPGRTRTTPATRRIVPSSMRTSIRRDPHSPNISVGRPGAMTTTGRGDIRSASAGRTRKETTTDRRDLGAGAGWQTKCKLVENLKWSNFNNSANPMQTFKITMCSKLIDYANLMQDQCKLVGN